MKRILISLVKEPDDKIMEEIEAKGVKALKIGKNRDSDHFCKRISETIQTYHVAF